MKQIRRIKTIGRFGAFKGFVWNLTDGNNKEILCQPLNFIYGRNYSGKTTLSKILQAFELKQLPSHYDDVAFELEFSDNSVLDATQVAELDVPVRVFNRDFVADNLAFFRDTRQEDAHINSFAVLGEGSKEVEAEIKQITEEIGEEKGVESTGLYKSLFAAKQSLAVQLDEVASLNHEIKSLKNKIANGRPDGIRYKPWCGDQNYNIAKLDKDIGIIDKKHYAPLSESEVDHLKHVVADTIRASIILPELPPLKMTQLLDVARPLLSRVVVQQQSIEEFINDSAREAWARSGYELHKDHHETCAFCGQTISDQRWQALRQCFENEAEDLRHEILNLLRLVDGELTSSETWPEVSPSHFYAEFEQKAKDIQYSRIKAQRKYRAALKTLRCQLESRLKSIATPIAQSLPQDESSMVREVQKELVSLVVENNRYSDSLRDEQEKAQVRLRLHEVFVALQDDELRGGINRATVLADSVAKQSDLVNTLSSKINVMSARRNELRQLRHDESGAAKLINTYLSWMGENNALSLETKEIEEDGVKSKVFRIVRGETPAYNLSEGECNLIAFCYFLAKLSSPELQNNKPIIWIDDPISSLDLNHIYFVYAMIRGVVLDGKRYRQLFISTHNLEFTRYLKRMSDWETKSGGKEEPVPFEWFYVHHSPDGSVIEVPPKYLKNYITEFSYLFSQIYNAAKADPNEEGYERQIYGFGNAARRFLEIYLYFKFPNDLQDDKIEHTRRMTELFDDKVRCFMVDRVINEMSHEPGALERAMAPIDSVEVHEVALEILRGLKKADERQYDNLLKGIGKDDPLETGTVSQS